MLGNGYYYFGNGKLQKQVEYIAQPEVKNQMGSLNKISPLVKLFFMQDSLGVVAVKDGNGHVIEKTGTGKAAFTEEGDYKDGFKNGIWKAINDEGTFGYTETFENGKFKNGESFKDGKKYTYTVQEEPPQFKGGQAEWGQFIASETKYPSVLSSEGISGKVFASFVIDMDGRITDIKIERSVHDLLDKEAIRVLQTAPRWIPGKQKGIPVRVKYNQAFSFGAR